MCRTIITNGTIVNDGEHFIGSIIVKGEFIESVIKGKLPENIVCNTDRIIDASGKWILPGVIDDQVHFREPGLTHKAEIATESVAAVAGGITSFMEMPIPFPKRRPSKPSNGNTPVQPKFPRRTILFISALPTTISRY